MHFRHFYLFTVCAALAGCASTSNDASEASAEVVAGVHEPQGEERKAILAAFRERLVPDLQGQDVLFNARDPVGRFMANADWAYFQGIVEGPDGNARPIDWLRSAYARDFELGFLDGVERNGHFASRFTALAHREADGSWHVFIQRFGANEFPAYGVGWAAEGQTEWASIPPPALRNVFTVFPIDDLHEPQGEERSAILAVMRAQLTPDLNGQAVFFNATDPAGSFLTHDRWAYFDGIVEGPNGNAQPIDYRNSIYADQQGAAFRGVLRNNNFAATFRALLQQDEGGAWHVFKPATPDLGAGYAVGKAVWVGDPESRYAHDITPPGTSGDGGGDGGDGGGDGAPADGDGAPADGE